MLSIRDLSLSFGGIQVLDKLSFDVPAQRIFAIIGPNGAGKTSVLNCLSGFYRPSRGRIQLNGEDITTTRAHRRVTLGLARTFQNIALFEGMSVLDNLKLGAHAHLHTGLLASLVYWGRAHAEEMALRREIEQIIDFLALEAVRKLPVGALAYGLQKRVELARALAMRPKLLLLDEPVAGMNAEETEDMARFILDIKEERNLTIVLIEHNMSLVMDISDSVLVLDLGRMIAAGAPHEVQSNPAVVRAYLGTVPRATPGALRQSLNSPTES